MLCCLPLYDAVASSLLEAVSCLLSLPVFSLIFPALLFLPVFSSHCLCLVPEVHAG